MTMQQPNSWIISPESEDSIPAAGNHEGIAARWISECQIGCVLIPVAIPRGEDVKEVAVHVEPTRLSFSSLIIVNRWERDVRMRLVKVVLNVPKCPLTRPIYSNQIILGR